MDAIKIIIMADKLLCSSPSLPPSLLSVSLHLVTSLLLVMASVSECHSHFQRLLWLLCSRGGCEEVMSVLECFRELADNHPKFQTVGLFLTFFGHYALKKFSSSYLSRIFYQNA